MRTAVRRLAWWGFIALLWWSALWRRPALPGPWGVPDGLLLALLAWVLSRRGTVTTSAALWVGAGFGALKDAAGSGPFGGWVVIFAVTAWLAARADRTIARDHPVPQFLWVTLCAMGTVAAYAALMAVRGEAGLAWALAGYFLIPSAVLTALAGLVLFPLCQRLLVGR